MHLSMSMQKQSGCITGLFLEFFNSMQNAIKGISIKSLYLFLLTTIQTNKNDVI